MALTFTLVLPPPTWTRQMIELLRHGGFGIAHLTRNFYLETREFVAQAVRPAGPGVRGQHFAPLDDLLVVRLQPRLTRNDADRLLTEFAPLPMQVVVGLVLGHGPAAGEWLGAVQDGKQTHRLAGIRLVGPGMRAITATPSGSEDESSPALERWSRTRGALGDAVFQRLRESRVAVIGASRNGSAAALTLAMLGVKVLVLIDPDCDELHNLDATPGATPAGLGRPKVMNRAETLKAIRPTDLAIQALPHSVLDPRAVHALRAMDLLVTCVDRDAPRLAAAMLANRWGKVHLDIGTGIFRSDGRRQMGADIRLLMPGDACVVCLGGLRDFEEARYEVHAPPGSLPRRPPRPWHEERAGSLVTINQVAVNLGVEVWLDLLAGRVTESRWQHLEWSETGIPQITMHTRPLPRCALCGSGTAPPSGQPGAQMEADSGTVLR